ncbi:hypothetical protein ACQ4WX_44790 [Streptomyces lasalocidi]
MLRRNPGKVPSTAMNCRSWTVSSTASATRSPLSGPRTARAQPVPSLPVPPFLGSSSNRARTARSSAISGVSPDRALGSPVAEQRAQCPYGLRATVSGDGRQQPAHARFAGHLGVLGRHGGDPGAQRGDGGLCGEALAVQYPADRAEHVSPALRDGARRAAEALPVRQGPQQRPLRGEAGAGTAAGGGGQVRCARTPRGCPRRRRRRPARTGAALPRRPDRPARAARLRGRPLASETPSFDAVRPSASYTT